MWPRQTWQLLSCHCVVVMLIYSFGVCQKEVSFIGKGRAALKWCSSAWEESVSEREVEAESAELLWQGKEQVATLEDWKLDGTAKEWCDYQQGINNHEERCEMMNFSFVKCWISHWSDSRLQVKLGTYREWGIWKWMVLFLWVFKVICVVPMSWIGNPLAIPLRKHVGDGCA